MLALAQRRSKGAKSFDAVGAMLSHRIETFVILVLPRVRDEPSGEVLRRPNLVRQHTHHFGFDEGRTEDTHELDFVSRFFHLQPHDSCDESRKHNSRTTVVNVCTNKHRKYMCYIVTAVDHHPSTIMLVLHSVVHHILAELGIQMPKHAKACGLLWARAKERSERKHAERLDQFTRTA